MLMRPYAWIMFLWALVFSYTWLTYQEASPTIRSIPVWLNIAAGIILIAFLCKNLRTSKNFILALLWVVIISVGLLLHIHGDLEDTLFNILIAIMTAIASGAWCITSHAENVTEAGLHWYVWTMLVIVALCVGFNGQGETARLVYMFAAAISLPTQIYYIYHIFTVQSPGTLRRQHVFRVSISSVLVVAIFIGAILIADNSISDKSWYELIFSVELLAAASIIIDFIIGFSQQTIYGSLDQNDKV